VAVAHNLSAHWAFERFDLEEEACLANVPHEFYFVCELSGCEGGVSIMTGKIRSISFGFGLEVTMFGGVVEGNDGGGKTVFSCICFDIDVDKVS
jgi:hypothetical protein